MAIEIDSMSTLETLIEKSNQSERDENGNTPLMLAAKHNQIERIRELKPTIELLNQSNFKTTLLDNSALK